MYFIYAFWYENVQMWVTVKINVIWIKLVTIIKLLEHYTDRCDWFEHQSFLFLVLPPTPVFKLKKPSCCLCVNPIFVVILLFLQGAGDGSEVKWWCPLTVAETKTDVLLVPPRRASRLWWYSSPSCHPRLLLNRASVLICNIAALFGTVRLLNVEQP